MEVESLRSHVAQLEAELREKEKDVYTAAELGKKLLESNQELQSQMDESSKEYAERIEVSLCNGLSQFFEPVDINCLGYLFTEVWLAKTTGCCECTCIRL